MANVLHCAIRNREIFLQSHSLAQLLFAFIPIAIGSIFDIFNNNFTFDEFAYWVQKVVSTIKKNALLIFLCGVLTEIFHR